MAEEMSHVVPKAYATITQSLGNHSYKQVSQLQASVSHLISQWFNIRDSVLNEQVTAA